MGREGREGASGEDSEKEEARMKGEKIGNNSVLVFFNGSERELWVSWCTCEELCTIACPGRHSNSISLVSEDFCVVLLLWLHRMRIQKAKTCAIGYISRMVRVLGQFATFLTV